MEETIPMALRVVSSSPAIHSLQRRAASILPSTVTLPNNNSSRLSSSSAISSIDRTKSVTLRSKKSRRNGVVTCSASSSSSVLPKALLFDCDGVLVDTEKDGHRISFNDTFAEVHFDNSLESIVCRDETRFEAYMFGILVLSSKLIIWIKATSSATGCTLTEFLIQ